MESDLTAPQPPKNRKRFLTPEESKQVALDLFNNRIFCSDQIRNIDEIHLVFMPLGFMDKEQLQELIDTKVMHFYEYFDRALPRSINGYPIFASMRTMTKLDYEAVRGYEEALRRAADEALGRSQSPEYSGGREGTHTEPTGHSERGDRNSTEPMPTSSDIDSGNQV